MYAAAHRKQVLLFLIAVVLPSAVLVYFTSRMLEQEQELIEKRERDQRLLLARELGQVLLRRLERIKQDELQRIQDSVASVGVLEYANPEVEIIGLVKEGRLILPWELDPAADRSLDLLNNHPFSEHIRRGKETEFVGRSFRKAAESYRQALAIAQDPVQEAYASLLLARVLRRMEMAESSLALYRKLLELPFDLVDESGIPFALFAADALVSVSGESSAVVERLQARLTSRDWLAPPEAYFMEELLETITKSLIDQPASKTAANCLQSAAEQVQKAEQALALKREFPNLFVPFVERDQPDREDPWWIPFGQNRWLVSLAGSEQEDRFLFAVGTEEVLESARAERFVSGEVGRVSLVSAISPIGQLLGPNFPGLKANIETNPNETEPRALRLRLFYLLAVVLALSVTFFGAYLLWRDVRREVGAAELRSQFVSSVSHELKTPLTAIRMFAETLRLGRTRDPNTRNEYLETIVNEAQRLTRLLNNVLSFSRIESGKRDYRPEAINLNDVIHDAVRAMEYPLKQGRFQLEIETDSNLPQVAVDRDGLEQAILNLLDNAMKYSGDSRQIDLTLRGEDSQAVIKVRDHGLGIDPKEQQRIFEKFYRVSSPASKRIPGTGLGLSLVSHLVRAHGGRLEVESRLGQGSTFSIYLPFGAAS